jgi:hypothetical protein
LFKTKQLIYLKVTCRRGSVATTTRNQGTLLRSCADTATAARERGTAAFRLALIVLKDEKGIGTRFKFRAHEFLIRGGVTPSTYTILRHDILGIKVSNGFIALSNTTSIFQEIVAKSFTGVGKHTGSGIDHQDIGCEEDNKTCDKESETHDSSLLKDFFRSLRV